MEHECIYQVHNCQPVRTPVSNQNNIYLKMSTLICKIITAHFSADIAVTICRKIHGCALKYLLCLYVYYCLTRLIFMRAKTGSSSKATFSFCTVGLQRQQYGVSKNKEKNTFFPSSQLCKYGFLTTKSAQPLLLTILYLLNWLPLPLPPPPQPKIAVIRQKKINFFELENETKKEFSQRTHYIA